MGIWLNGGSGGDGKYHETFAHDAVGNITALTRNAGTPPAGGGSAGQVGSGPTMDNMTYSYDARTVTISLQQNSGSFSIPVLKSNRLYHVDDQVTGSYYSDDIDDQGSFNAAPSTINTANNYGYDELGNLVRDNAEEIANIGWNVSGKITSITRTAGSKKPDLLYGYDFAGSRLFKVVIPKVQTGVNTGKRRSQEHWDTTWYIHPVKYFSHSTILLLCILYTFYLVMLIINCTLVTLRTSRTGWRSIIMVRWNLQKTEDL